MTEDIKPIFEQTGRQGAVVATLSVGAVQVRLRPSEAVANVTEVQP